MGVCWAVGEGQPPGAKRLNPGAGEDVAISDRRRIARQGPGGPGRRLSRRRAARRPEPIDAELARRQGGYGRGGRQQIETDHVDILSGIWRGMTLGSPIALLIPNKDYKIDQMEDLARPRPGHGDLSGSIKYLASVRAILERASARETAARVAAGALAKQLLAPLGIRVLGYVVEVGPLADRAASPARWTEQRALRDRSILYTLDPGPGRTRSRS